MQHTLDDGRPGTPPRPAAGIMPFSLPSSESLPRCTTSTRFCESTVTPETDPITHESSGNGAGHKGATRYVGAAPCANTV